MRPIQSVCAIIAFFVAAQAHAHGYYHGGQRSPWVSAFAVVGTVAAIHAITRQPAPPAYIPQQPEYWLPPSSAVYSSDTPYIIAPRGTLPVGVRVYQQAWVYYPQCNCTQQRTFSVYEQ